MSTKTRAEVFIQPKNRRPLKRTAIIEYSKPAEMRDRIAAFARTIWISAIVIIVDTHSKEILVDGVPVANYALHTRTTDAPAPAKPARRKLYTHARHTTTHLTLIAAGLLLIITAGPALNGAWILGVIIAGYGIYRMALGVQRSEARRSPAAAVESVTVDELLRGAA